jgi:hypothetical protein
MNDAHAMPMPVHTSNSQARRGRVEDPEIWSGGQEKNAMAQIEYRYCFKIRRRSYPAKHVSSFDMIQYVERE